MRGPFLAVAAVAGVILAIAGSASSRSIYAAAQAGGPGADGAVARAQSQPAANGAPGAHAALFSQYCISCHNERLKTAGLMLDRLAVDRIDGAADAVELEAWEKVVRKLRSGAMPPVGLPRPGKAEYDVLAGSIEAALDRRAAAAPNPGRPVVHRLNRVEYTNAIRDLLGLDIDARAILPADEAAYGFDNIADVLKLSQGLLERYLLAAQRISTLATGLATRPAVHSYKIPLALVQDDRVSEDLPFGSRGGAAIRHHFAADGEYVVRLRLRRTFNNGVITGLARPEQLDIRIDGVRVASFAVGGECVRSSEPRCVRPPTFGARTTIPSEYERTADVPLQVRVPVSAGTRLLGVQFLKRVAPAPEGAAPLRHPAALASATDEDVEMMIESVQVEGPFNATASASPTPSERAVFVCRPRSAGDEERCATDIVRNLVRRAYRRPATDEDVETLLKLYRSGRREASFETGIQFALEGVLVSPNFLFRIERDPASVRPGSVYRLTDLELASRLSFFLWSSIPDEELLQTAVRGGLSDARTLDQQLRRMVLDRRAAALVDNFAGQWLHLRNVRVATPDPRVFPDFDENLRDAFRRETELFLASQLREDRSVLDLLRADYTFVNERLARFYGIPNVYGSHYRRVAVTDDHRRGLLGHGSILTVTSYSTRTSPVLRGKWLLENILGAPPPPPPPNVPDLDLARSAGGDVPRSVRQRLEEHRKSPGCAGCHAVMDPLGFALENFDGVGKWRTRDDNQPIDASGRLLDGTRFNGVAEFRNVLLTQGDAFARTVTEKLMTYALGRELRYHDMPAVRAIVRDAAREEYRWSSLIAGVVRSQPFQMRIAD
jgi:mono/diheme cytochrome c family protein